MADMAHIAGLIAGGVAENPLQHGFHVMTTTTHKTLRGPRGGLILSMGTVSSPLKAPEQTVENIPTLIDRAVFPGMQGGPHMHVIAAKAVAFGEALQPEFKEYAAQIVKNAARLADELKGRGFELITGGTSNHLILADVYKSFGIDGKVAEVAMDKIGLTLNANAIPDDPLPMFRPSGIRLGTPALTTRGLTEDDMPHIADWMKQAIDARDDASRLTDLKNEVKLFLEKY
jgi:glycine hydroxymethyltransferase